MPSRPIFTDTQTWALAVALGVFGSSVGIALLLAVYVVLKL